MANRNWASGGKIYSMHVSPVMLDAQINIGASGAVSSITGPTIASVTHVSTGIYKINLQDRYNGLIGVMTNMTSPTVGLSGISSVELANAQSAAVQTATPSVTIQTLNSSGVLTDPASGSQISAIILLSNSSVKVQGES